MKRRVLFLCTGNSCRSQMAEGFAKKLGKDIIECSSAGTLPRGLDPRAVTVMKEKGIDISEHSSDMLTEKHLQNADVIVTLCGEARDGCPVPPDGVKKLHWALEDPAKLHGEGEETMEAFRRVRDEIESLVKKFLKGMIAK